MLQLQKKTSIFFFQNVYLGKKVHQLYICNHGNFFVCNFWWSPKVKRRGRLHVILQQFIQQRFRPLCFQRMLNLTRMYRVVKHIPIVELSPPPRLCINDEIMTFSFFMQIYNDLLNYVFSTCQYIVHLFVCPLRYLSNFKKINVLFYSHPRVPEYLL